MGRVYVEDIRQANYFESSEVERPERVTEFK